MEVFLIPVGADRYELYCEPAAEPAAGDAASPAASWRDRLGAFVSRVAAEGERVRQGEAHDVSHGRVRRVLVRWIAEAVAEQRLLWRLRREGEARLVHPDELDGPRAEQILRRQLNHDLRRHRRWMLVNAVLAVASIPVALLPGPNVIGFYFLFRAVGHLLSMRGADHGRRRVQWRRQPSADLTRLARALQETEPARRQTVEDVAGALGLPRLAAHLARVAQRG